MTNKSSLQAEIGLIEKFLRDYKINASVNKGAHLLPGKGSFVNVRGDQQQRFQAYLLDDAADLAQLRIEQGGVQLAEVQQVIRDRWVAQLPLLTEGQ